MDCFHTELVNALLEQVDLPSSLEILKPYKHLFSAHNTPLIKGRIPRLYKRDDPLQSSVKEAFSHLPSLQALSEKKASLSLDEEKPLPAGSTICLFTYMIGGWGDLIACKEVAKILKERFPDLSILSVVCIPSHLRGVDCGLDETMVPIFCDTECPLSSFPTAALQALLTADLILSIPTFYPHTQDLKDWLVEQKQGNPPRFVCIGQYGFLESQWFHPQSCNLSMGLHPLEMGILTRPPREKADFILDNTTLLKTLFGNITPHTDEVENYLASHQLYLAYLISPIGGAVYLHALLQSQLSNHKAIDICTPDIGWLIAYIQTQKKGNRPLLEGDFGIAQLEIHFEGMIERISLRTSGKTVRILCPGALSDADFRCLVAFSAEFIAVRGDQSFSEVVCADRLFFYDAPSWARYFIKDLLELATTQLESNRAALSLFRCMGEVSLYNIPEETGEWVEETHFQEKRPWTLIAQEMAAALQSPEAITGYRELNKLIRSEHSFNKTLCHIVQRELG